VVRAGPGGTVVGGACGLADREALAETLGRPATLADGDLLAAAWSRWGLETPAHLHGDFALFAYDPERESLWLCRDETPHRPLYFVRRPGHFVAFANHPRPLLALPWVDPALDEVAFAAAVSLIAMDPGETGYRDLRRVPRAHVQVLTPDGVSRRPWWTAQFRDPPAGWKDDDYVTAACGLFDRVVRDQCRDGGKLGILLSGGMDSQAVADSVMRQTLGPLTGYAVLDPPERCLWRDPRQIGDQRPQVDAFLKRHPGMTARIIPYATVPGDDATRERMRRMGMFSVVPHPSGMMEDARQAMAADGVTTVLGGHGGNQTLSSDGWQRLDALRDGGRWLRLGWEALWCILRQGPGLARPMAARTLPDWALRAWRGRRPRPPAASNALGFLSPDMAAAVRERYGEDKCFRTIRDTRANMLDSLRRDHAYLDGAFLAWRTNGMALRTPLADRRIIDFALSIPADQFLRRGHGRWLMRRMMAGRLPDEILRDQRHSNDLSSFPVRAGAWRTSLGAALPGLRSSRLARQIFDLDAIGRFIDDDWPSSDGAASWQAVNDLSAIGNAVMAARFVQMIDGGNG
jgi:asparagine synthase (glutamine-hydrolysing)